MLSGLGTSSFGDVGSVVHVHLTVDVGLEMSPVSHMVSSVGNDYVISWCVPLRRFWKPFVVCMRTVELS